jgi:hypothetical protein
MFASLVLLIRLCKHVFMFLILQVKYVAPQIRTDIQWFTHIQYKVQTRDIEPPQHRFICNILIWSQLCVDACTRISLTGQQRKHATLRSPNQHDGPCRPQPTPWTTPDRTQPYNNHNLTKFRRKRQTSAKESTPPHRALKPTATSKNQAKVAKTEPNGATPSPFITLFDNLNQL